MNSPSTPNLFPQSLKSFWSRPEGKPGMVIASLLAGAAVYGAWLVIPFLIALTLSTIQLVFLVAVLAALVYILTNATFLTLCKNIFQSCMRGIARLYTEVDPIGILRNNLDDMRSEKSQLDQTIERFAGSDQRLQDSIARKREEIGNLQGKVRFAEGQTAKAKSALEKERFILARQTALERAGLLMKGVGQLETLEKSTSDMLGTFRHWSQVADSKIERTKNKVDFLAEQRAMILDAKSTLSVGQRLLRGNPEQLQLVDMALDYLEEDTSRTLGEIREFSRFSDKLLTDMDIESGAAAQSAADKFASFNQRLLAASNSPEDAEYVPTFDATPVPVTLTSTAIQAKPEAPYAQLLH